VKRSRETIGQKRILVLGEGVDIVDQRQLAGEESALPRRTPASPETGRR
jgi:hypothetical protein